MKTISLWWRGRGFGEPLIMSLVVNILNDNGVDAVLRKHRKVSELVDCPLISREATDKTFQTYAWTYECCSKPIILQYIEYFENVVGKSLKITRDYIPVKFYDILEVPSVDIVMGTRTGNWSPYRNWPYFEKLKKLFNKEGITYIDLDTNGIRGVECLNYVNKCKLFLGLETGMSHYVSQFANGKTLILQSGFSEFEFWAYLYDYDHLQVEDVPCRPCFINKQHIARGERKCKLDNICMKNLTVDRVFEAVTKRI